MSGVWKGALLGIANVVVIAIGIAMLGTRSPWHDGSDGVGKLVFLYGSLPGLICGVCVGCLAHVLDRSSTLLRLSVVTLPALGLVFLLASGFEMMNVALVSCIPTIVAALILERWTRRPADPPLVPVARSVR